MNKNDKAVEMQYSVLMSVYKKEKPEWFRLAVQSMLDQSLAPDEIVIVEDGKLSVELESIVQQFEKNNPKMFKIIRNPVNQGLGKALNCGLRACRNDIVARMDTDDISFPNRCEKEIKILEDNEELVLVGAWVDEFIDDPHNIISTRRVPYKYDEICKFARRRNPFNHPTVVFRKSIIEKMGGYSELRYGQDYELFGRIIISGYRVRNIPQSLLWFRRNENTANKRKNVESIQCYLKTIKKFQELGFSSYYDYLFVYITQNILRYIPNVCINFIYRIIRWR